MSRKGSTIYAGMDCKTGNLIAIAEWKFNFGVDVKKKKELKIAFSAFKDDVVKQVRF